ncbi:hypothetical protein GLAREA_02315 [Glarea lozoyensis ATCC 20868]|uniref:2EXR domain-containing protein n=1 Tax=Glarea lozoyensis (strain ATCC 20868 / MF5171) TaxID=1116229 RepID=S3CIT0_GLAL2|nr:uncharacterized protein GLAREA_02315 [Glarea lozoyensis ATCC 20868]EPE26402.1 hypothetical protein GLAREA_02315 [Glarea lozoyensis ATCC 20868]
MPIPVPNPVPFFPFRHLLPLGEQNADVDYFEYINDSNGSGHVLARELSVTMSFPFPKLPSLNDDRKAFTLFPELPWDIQLMIIDLARSGPRIIALRRIIRTTHQTRHLIRVPFVENFEFGLPHMGAAFVSEHSHLEGDRHIHDVAGVLLRLGDFKNPALLYVNRAIRFEMLKHYKQLEYQWSQYRFGDDRMRSSDVRYARARAKPAGLAFFNPHLDNITIDKALELEYFTNWRSANKATNDLERHVRHLTIRDSIVDAWGAGLPAQLLRFMSLETITMLERGGLEQAVTWSSYQSKDSLSPDLKDKTRYLEKRLKTAFEDRGKTAPYIIDISMSQFRSWKRVLGEDHIAGPGIQEYYGENPKGYFD